MAALVGASVLLAGVVTACGTPDPGPAASCSWMARTADPVRTAKTADPSKAASPAKTAADSGSSVVLVDDSTSVQGSAGGQQGRDYAAAAKDAIAELVGRRDTFSVGAFSGDAGRITWIARDQSADWKLDNPDPDNRTERQKEAADCLAKDISDAERGNPTGGGTDVLAAMTSGVGALAADSGATNRHLVVLTDGLSTTGCADLRSAGFRTDEEITAIAGVCAARREIPALHAVKTEIIGLAQSASDQKKPSALQRDWLADLWTALCAKGGGACAVPPVTVDTTRRTRTVAGAARDPLVGYGDGRVRTYSLPGAALFATDSWAVRDSARAVLTTIAVSARTVDGSRVVVDGYVDPRGGPGNNHQLSQARADAVGGVLRELGATHVTTRGLGVAPGCPAATGRAAPDPDQADPDQALQCDRRVDINIIGQ